MPDGLSAEAIEAIENLVNEARKTTVLEAPGEPNGHYYLIGPDGKSESKITAAAWHSEELETPAELLKFIRKETSGNSEDDFPTVYVSDEKIVFVYDQFDRRNRAYCNLKLSPYYKFLAAIDGKPMSQADFVRALRINLSGCLPAESGLLGLIRNLKWTLGADGDADIQHARQSIARSTIASVKGADNIPEEIGLTIPVFENHRYAHRVLCAIEVVVTDEKFKLTPYPMQLRQALDGALLNISDLLSGGGEDEDPGTKLPPVYRGRP